MSITDADRWNRRYQSPAFDKLNQPRKLLLDNKRFIPETGRALDIACGLGHNSIFLSQMGLQVFSVDISIKALIRLQERAPRVNAILADLDNFFIPNESFSIITNFYYFNPHLFGQLSKLLTQSGVVFVETLTKKMTDIKPEIERKHLLEPGELISIFQDLEILYYFEGWLIEKTGKQKAVAQLVAQKL